MLIKIVYVYRVYYCDGNNVCCIGVFESFCEVVLVIIKIIFGFDLKEV